MRSPYVIIILLVAAVLGFALHNDHPHAVRSTHVETPWENCRNTITAMRLPAGDLCDTLPPNVDVTQRQWDHYNHRNGWQRLAMITDLAGRGTNDCWDTSATTAVHYYLCFDGTIGKAVEDRN